MHDSVPQHDPHSPTLINSANEPRSRPGAGTATAPARSGSVGQEAQVRPGRADANAKAKYLTRYRRLLLDMHIPDWDERFLADYDPRAMAALYEEAHANAVMMYCQSHVGLCYWPTDTAKMHPGIHGRDIVGEMLDELHRRDIAACAYYSLIFNNWAFHEHPEWRMVFDNAHLHNVFASSRYGLCCPNNPDYREFAMAQTRELLDRYDFDALFFDMTFWPGVCLCTHCRSRYATETGNRAVPERVDWTNPDWCRFQRAREEWIDDFAHLMTQCAKQCRPRLPVYHNFALATCGWTFVTPFSSARHHDFLGADFYGDAAEQLVVTKLMNHLTENRPMEFMTSQCTDLKDHVQLKSSTQLELQAFAATLHSAAILFIDAIDPSGSVNEEIYRRTGEIYRKISRYEPWLGGSPVEDIAVYFSNESKLEFSENGDPLRARRGVEKEFSHRQAVQGICLALQQAHLPFGVITRKNLPDLERYSVLVLPNIMRMDDDEVDAVRRFVANGGRLYASGWTSLTHTSGERKSDFMLADVFGVRFAEEETSAVTYVEPAGPLTRDALHPQRYLSAIPKASPDREAKTRESFGVRLASNASADVLATLALPYAAPEKGTALDKNWASIHSSPPWQSTDTPCIVRNRYGDGEAIYSSVPIEAQSAPANVALWRALIESLMPGPSAFHADAHPDVWMNVQRHNNGKRFTIGFLNYQKQLPPVPVARIPFRLRIPDGRSPVRLVLLPDETPADFAVDGDFLLAEARDLELFQMYLLDLA